MAGWERATLPNGVRVVAEYMPYVRSVSLGIFVAVGSRDEREGELGASHFLEHLAFKGTERRTARQIAEESDLLGGHLNAYTTREYTCYHIKVLDERFQQALELLADLVVRPVMAPADVEKERQVILEELRLVEDTPEELLQDLFAASLWPQDPLGRPVAGTAASVRSLERETLWAFHRRHYTAANLVLAVAGHVPFEVIYEAAQEQLGALPPGTPQVRQRPLASSAIQRIRAKPTEQVYVCLGTGAPALLDDELWATALLAAVLGGGSSSRLFQAAREERGLVYDIGAFHHAHSDAGAFGISFAASPATASEAIEICFSEWRRLLQQSVGWDELERHKSEFKASFWLGLEGTYGRMSRLGRSEVLTGCLLSPEEVIARLEAVTPEDVLQLARRLGDPRDWVAVSVGPRKAAAVWKGRGAAMAAPLREAGR